MATTHPISSAWKIIPQFHSKSVPDTVRFYTEELGFKAADFYPPGSVPPRFCAIAAGYQAAANIYLHLTSPESFRPSSVMIAMGAEELDQLHDKVAHSGNVTIQEGLEDKPWGYRQFTILDCDGNELTFFRFLGGATEWRIRY